MTANLGCEVEAELESNTRNHFSPLRRSTILYRGLGVYALRVRFLSADERGTGRGVLRGLEEEPEP